MSARPDPFEEPGADDPAELRLFEQALEIGDAAGRHAFLEASCAGDPVLLRRLRVLLQAHESGTSMAFPTWRSPLERIAPMPFDDRLPVAEDSLVPNAELLIDKYRVIRRIGEGGCGTVYLAEQETPVRRQVALKLIKPGMDSRQVIARFELERQTLAILDHPNIARILDAGTTDAGRPYFVMEYVRGERINHYCDQHRLNIRQRLDLFIDVCLAVQHAHQKGVIHRDLKPSNILVAQHDGAGIPKVIDFGIAKAIGNPSAELTLQTEVDQLLGTPAYMSPEQARSGTGGIDTRSDVYSLGVVLYELLAGETPFDPREFSRQGFDAVRQSILGVDPVRPSRRLAKCPPARLAELAAARSTSPARLLQDSRVDLDWIVMKALEKDRARRYATANGLASDLRRHLGNEVVEARPPSATYRLHKAYQRNRAWMLAGIVAVVAVVVALIVSVGMYRREARSRSEAERLLARSAVEAGWAKWTEGDFQGSMAAFTEALELDGPDTERARLHRLRLAAVERSRPHLAFSWSAGVPITAAAFATEETGHRGLARVWDVDRGEPLSAPMAHEAPIHIALFSRDGHRVLTASEDGRLRVWDAESGAPTTGFLDLGQDVEFARFSPDGELVFAGSGSGRDHANGVLQLWEVRESKSRWRESVPGASFCTAAFSPDGKWIACGSHTFAALLIPSDGSDAVGIPDCWRALALDFSPDGRRLLVTGTFGPKGEQVGTRILDVDSRKYVGSLTPHITEAGAARFAPDGRHFASGGGDQIVQVGQADSPLSPEQGLVNHTTVERFAFSPDSRLLAAACADGCIRTWHVASGLQFMSALPHAGRVLDALFSAEGAEIRTISGDGSVNAWSVRPTFPADIEYRQKPNVDAIRTGMPEGLLIADASGISVLDPEKATLRRHYEQVCEGPWRQIGVVDGGYLLSFDAGIYHIERQTGAVRLEVPGYNARTDQILSYDGGRKAFRGYIARKQAVAFDVHTGRDVQRFEAPTPLTAATLTPDEHQLVGFGTLDQVWIWDVESGRLLRSGTRRGARGDAARLDFTPDGRHLLATMGAGLSPELHEFSRLLEGGEPVALGRGVSTSALSPDGRFIASGDAIGVISIRQTEDPRRSRTWRGHRRHVDHVEFNDGNSLLFTSSRDGTAAVWEARTGLSVVPPILRENSAAPATYDGAHSMFWVATGIGELKAWHLVPDRRSLGELRREYGVSKVANTWDPGESWRAYQAVAPRKAIQSHTQQ